jgi:RimJ/RimL family protein N-acetyltransferase
MERRQDEHQAAYPSELIDHIRLANDRLLHIRPLRTCDEGTIRELYSRLSPRTRYFRFFSPMPRLPDAVVKLLTRLDYRRRLALLAELDIGERAEVAGLGSFGAIGDGTAEVGLVVRDEWQRQGIGVALAMRVLLAAEARGFDRFVAYVLSGNIAMKNLLNHVGVVVSTKTIQGVSEVSFVRRSLEGS